MDCRGAIVLPGLINAHDHLELNSFARLKWRDQYANVRDWIADFQPRFQSDPALAAACPGTLGDRLIVGALKNLLSGVTTVCHHNPLRRPLRRRSPVRIVRRFGFSHSLLVDGERVRRSFRRTPRSWPWIIHAAEGIDGEAAREVPLLDAWGCLGPNTTLVHGIAITPVDRTRVIERGGALVWCPASNDFLFGTTADVRAFSRARRLALGTDSRLSGEQDLLAELRAARRTGQLDPRELVRAITSDAADVLRLPDAGRLSPGVSADLTIVAPLCSDPFEALLEARRTDIRLTTIEGWPVVGDLGMAPLFAAARLKAAAIRLDSQPRLMAAPLARRVSRLRLREPGLEVSA